MSLNWRGCCVAAALVLITGKHAEAQLERTFAAHGGLPIWRTYRTVAFDLDWNSERGRRLEQHSFDLQSRAGFIKADGFTLTSDGKEVWVTPNLEALRGMPARFYMWTPFYFFAMPFVFADSGVVLEPLGTRKVGEVDYDAVKISFKPGTGDSPEDYYIAHLDKQSGQLNTVVYIVTHPSLRKGKDLSELEEHAIVFDQWQTANDLSVPKRARLFDWKNGNLSGEAAGTLQFSNVNFSSEAQTECFKKPENAVVAPRQ